MGLNLGGGHSLLTSTWWAEGRAGVEFPESEAKAWPPHSELQNGSDRLQSP